MIRTVDGGLGFGRALRVVGLGFGRALHLGGATALLLAMAVVLGACSPASPVAPSASPSPTAMPTISADARAMLDAALAPLSTSAEFESTVTVDGKEVTALVGRTVGDNTSLSVATSGRTVDYVRVPPKAWAREPNASWLLVDASQAPDSPMAALAAPLTLEVGPGTPTTLTATYPAAALGLTGGPATVTITLLESGVMFQYQQTTGGRTVASETTLRPATDTSPIVAPAP
jgi:hypothetical protein